MGFSLYDVRRVLNDPQSFADTYAPGSAIGIAQSDDDEFCLMGLLLANNDDIPHVFVLWFGFSDGSKDARLLSVTVPAGAGYAGVPPTDALANLPLTPTTLLILGRGGWLNIDLEDPPSSGKSVLVFPTVGIF